MNLSWVDSVVEGVNEVDLDLSKDSTPCNVSYPLPVSLGHGTFSQLYDNEPPTNPI